MTTEETQPDASHGRRTFLQRLIGVLSAAIGLVVAVPCIGFVLAPLLRRPPRAWRGVGRLDDFVIGATVLVTFEDTSSVPWAGVTATSGAWLRRLGGSEFVAFSINCRHLGCPVRWEAGPQLFMCPCHGGVYDADGDVAAGPPPEPLARLAVRLRNGTVEIETIPQPLTTNDPL